MRKRMSFLVLVLWIASQFLLALPIQASSDSVLPDLPAITIEGEQYTSVNQTTVPKSERDSLRGNSTELSNNDFLFFKSLAGASIPESGYIADYEFNVSVPGTYGLDIVASPISMGHVSPYQIKINDGEYYDVNASAATQTGQLSSPANLFYKYKLLPVTLHEGTNKISFRIQSGRQQDGRLYFFLDAMQLTKLPWGLHGISADAPNLLFQESDDKQVTIDFTDDSSQGHNLYYQVEDYFGTVVAQNRVAFTENVPSYTFTLPQLQRGHYTITAEADENGQPIQQYLSVVMDHSERRTVQDSPFAVDAAGGSLFPAADAPDYARAIWLTGVDYVRERMHWNSISSAPGTTDFSKYDPYNEAYANYGIRVLELNHIAPTWAKDAGKNLPRNLLDAYELAKSSVSHYGSQSDWEFWNEPDIGYTAESEPADQYAAFLKATTIAARDAGVPTQVALAGIAYPPGNYVEQLMQNDIADYIDIYNFHGHRNDNENTKILDTPPTFAVNAEMIKGYGLDGKPIYVTESGISLKFNNGDQTLTKEQLQTQARYLATSTIESIAMGVDKHFWFVFPYYLENGMSWGSFSSQGTPYASINAEAAMTNALGEAVYLGQLHNIPEGVKSYAFKDGTDSIVAYWSENDTSLTLHAGKGNALLTDIMGREQQVASSSGDYDLMSGPDIHYLRISGNWPGLSNPAYAVPTPHAPALDAAERVVLVQRYPESAAVKAKTNGYSLDKLANTEVNLDVYNFNAAPMSGTITGTTYGGWNLSDPSQEVTIAPYSMETLTFSLTGSDAVAADVKFPVVFQGAFDGHSTSKSITMIASNENKIVEPNVLVPAYDDPAQWATNLSAGSSSTMTTPSPGEIQFNYNFGSGDKWTYPRFTLPPGVTFADSEGITFDVYFDAPVDGVVIRSFMYENNGAEYFTSAGIVPTGGWQSVKIPWSDFATFGTPDDNFHLDPDQINKFSIGINSRTATQVSYKVRNLGVYVQPDSGMYSKIANIAPAPSDEVTAGTVTISAELVQGEIPIDTGTVQVLVDGAPVTHQISGQTVTATAQLTSGDHALLVKGFDVNGRLVSAQSNVTVITATEPEPAKSANDIITETIAYISNYLVANGRNPLISKLENVSDSLSKGNSKAAINQLNAFANSTEAQRGKKLTQEQADYLICQATAIKNTIRLE
ncbi:hypothetical protein [Paenibacillus glycanilyticus]|uniref:Uncharacterized protein n=1 Tax=Paenibacillus glycanilyticus TaxID=126569 RepID=A0ABQ6GL96_9BACL|nr:hypothetical protein [Paenibacillus glycanilyticus]GLX71015.1 hypothetical protein MU1_53630 [Paenibacillus glycanilyticus]